MPTTSNREWSRAEPRIAGVARREPCRSEACVICRVALLAQGAIDEALTNLLAVREAVPQARVQLAKYYLKIGRKDDAVTELRAYASIADARRARPGREVA
jgi:hypothetical protein